MFKTSMIIPTYNRPDLLTDCLESILKQTQLPDEVIVVDDGNLVDRPLEQECTSAGIAYVYYKKQTPGLTESRNVGVELATGDIIFFLDDDVVLFADYIEEILRVYREKQGEPLGGVGGLIDNVPQLQFKDYLKGFVETLFLANGYSEGRVLPSGYFVQFGDTPFPISSVKRVDFLSGGVCSFPSTIFAEFKFTDRFRSFGLGEDKDFTLQVAKQYHLYVTPKARLLHLEAPAMRPDKRRWGKLRMTGIYILFKNFVRKSPFGWILFWYATCGYLIARVLAFMLAPNRGKIEQLQGTFEAIGNIISRRVTL